MLCSTPWNNELKKFGEVVVSLSYWPESLASDSQPLPYIVAHGQTLKLQTPYAFGRKWLDGFSIYRNLSYYGEQEGGLGGLSPKLPSSL